MSLLQMYPLETAGGIDSVLQTAVELRRRREEESKAAKTSGALGSRLRNTIWQGFTNQRTSPLPSPDMSDSSEEESKSRNEGDKTETPQVDAAPSTPGLTRLANVVWLGITNQSAMDVPPSPISPTASSSASPLPPSSPVSPALLSPASPLPPVSPQSPVSESSSLWSYAEKIRDSDTAASLAKASTNWRVKAMQAWNNRRSAPPSPSQLPSKDSRETELESTSPTQEAIRREGPISDTFRSEAYSPPARPAYFRPPRDSMLPQPRRSLLSSPTSPESGDDTASAKLNNIRDSIASLTGLVTTSPSKPSPKSGPRPLLLNSTSLLTRASPSPPIRSPPNRLRADSSSSAGFPAYTTAKPTRNHGSQSEWESDATESRIVPLNRRSVSPMAPQSRPGGHGRLQSSSSEKGVTRQDLFLNGGAYSPSGHSDGSASRGWGRIDALDSPSTLPSSPPLETPLSATLNSSAVSRAVYQRGLVITPELGIRVSEAPSQARKLVRKKTPPPLPDYTSDSSAAHEPPSRSPRLRSRRSPHHLARLHVQNPMPFEVNASPNRLALPELSDDHDTAITPRAMAFHESGGEGSAFSASPKSPAPGPYRTRKLSSDGRRANGDTSEPRVRKLSLSSHSPRTRKVSESRSAKQTESAAEEGDDEGYDELLNAYESEDSSMQHHVEY